MLCKWILMIRSSLTFGYIWYYYHFYFQNTSDLRNWNKIVIKILWLQGTGTHSSFTSLSNKWDCFKNAKHLHEFPGQEGLSFWKGQNKELNTRGSILSYSWFVFSFMFCLNLFFLCSFLKFSCTWKMDDPSTVHKNTFSIQQASLDAQLPLSPISDSNEII